jgi:hypothetical protein
MTTREVFIWMHINLRQYIDNAILVKKQANPSLIYTPDWLVAITYRETGELINRYASQCMKPEVVHTLMRGDYSQRPGETEKQYHGYGYTQIDIASFPAFIKSGKWKDPLQCYLMAIDVLEGKRHYIEPHLPKLGGDDLQRAITAAYNCGEGNVVKALTASSDVDSRTTGHDYSKDVWQRRNFYKQIVSELNN